MPRKPKITADRAAADLVRKARRALKQDHPLSQEERTMIEEVRSSMPRPTDEEISAVAKRIAKSSPKDA